LVYSFVLDFVVYFYVYNIHRRPINVFAIYHRNRSK